MIVLQPLYAGADRGRTGFDAAVIALDNGLGRGDLAGGVVEIADDIVMERTQIALKRQDIVATLIDLAFDERQQVRIDRVRFCSWHACGKPL